MFCIAGKAATKETEFPYHSDWAVCSFHVS